MMPVLTFLSVCAFFVFMVWLWAKYKSEDTPVQQRWKAANDPEYKQMCLRAVQQAVNNYKKTK